MLATLALIAASLSPFGAQPSLRKSPPRLSDQVDHSTLVCIGTVDEAITVQFPNGIRDSNGVGGRKSEFQFARVQVERVLKGDPRTKVVYHEAWSTWTCDTTHADIGRRSLYLLGPGVLARAHPEDQSRAASALGSDPILRNVSSGDGITRILQDGELEYVMNWGGPVSLRRSDGAKGFPLSAIVNWIETTARFSPELVTVHARCDRQIEPGPQGGETFDLRILPDGSRRLARKLGEKETVVVDRIDAAQWDALQRVLQSEVSYDDRLIDETRGWPKRTLTVRFDEHQLQFRQGWDQDLAEEDEAWMPGVRRALRVWTALGDVLDCPTCADHRQADARILDAR